METTDNQEAQQDETNATITPQETSPSAPTDAPQEDNATKEQEGEDKNKSSEVNLKNNSSSQPSLSQSFIQYLISSFAKEDLQANLRILNNGLFVNERFKKKFLITYKEWLKSQSGIKEKTIKEVEEQIFKTKRPLPYYLVQGKLSEVGYIIKTEQAILKPLNVTQYKGEPISAFDYIHPKDPLLTESKTIKGELTPEGLKITIELRNWKFILTPHIIKQFATILNKPSLLENKKSLPPISNRDSLKVLAKMLKLAKPALSKNTTLTPLRFNANYHFLLEFQETYFLVNKESRDLFKIYRTYGPAIEDFLLEELKILRKKKKFPSKKSKNKPPFFFIPFEDIHHKREARHTLIGEIFTETAKYKLTLKALIQFFRNLPFLKPEPNLKRSKLTIIDLVYLISKYFHDASIVNNNSDTESKNKRLLSIREIGNTTFYVEQKNIIKNIKVIRPKAPEQDSS